MTTTTPNRVWFITGTSSGLGRALVEVLLANGEQVIATCRKPSVLSSLTAKYSSDKLLVHKLDVTKPDEVKEALAVGVRKFGRIDVVVNNAGFGLFGEIEGIPEEDARYEFEVQFWGAVHVLKEAARIFREVNPAGAGGRLFSISTVGGYRANPTLAYYSASKFALEAFTQAFLQEMTPSWNIKGCIIEPGGFASEWSTGNAQVRSQHPAYTDPSNPCQIFRSMHGQIPVIGDANKMAKAIVRLADLSVGVRSKGIWTGYEKESKELGELPVELPLRVQFGSESQFLVQQQAKNTLRDADKWGWVSHSTNLDGVDGPAYVKDVLLSSGSFKDAE